LSRDVKNRIKKNSKKYILTGQVLNLLSKSSQFEFHKSTETLKAFMVVIFKVYGISRGTRKLIRIAALIKKIETKS
jgi:hypothetical protein